MMYFGCRHQSKTLVGVMAAKAAQSQGKRVLYFTNDQSETASMLSKHGALSEIVGENYVAPRWPKSKLNTL